MTGRENPSLSRKNYERMKELIDRWIELSTELSNLRLTRPNV